LWTDSRIEFCTSRVHRIRMGFCAARMSNARATPHDFPEPRPPCRTLYRDGLNSRLSLRGNCASTCFVGVMECHRDADLMIDGCVRIASVRDAVAVFLWGTTGGYPFQGINFNAVG